MLNYLSMLFSLAASAQCFIICFHALPHSSLLMDLLVLCALSPVLFKVYCSDHTYTTIRVPVAASVREVIGAVADKLGSAEDLLLVNLSSAGGEKGHSHTLIKRRRTPQSLSTQICLFTAGLRLNYAH